MKKLLFKFLCWLGFNCCEEDVVITEKCLTFRKNYNLPNDEYQTKKVIGPVIKYETRNGHFVSIGMQNNLKHRGNQYTLNVADGLTKDTFTYDLPPNTTIIRYVHIPDGATVTLTSMGYTMTNDEFWSRMDLIGIEMCIERK